MKKDFGVGNKYEMTWCHNYKYNDTQHLECNNLWLSLVNTCMISKAGQFDRHALLVCPFCDYIWLVDEFR